MIERGSTALTGRRGVVSSAFAVLLGVSSRIVLTGSNGSRRLLVGECERGGMVGIGATFSRLNTGVAEMEGLWGGIGEGARGPAGLLSGECRELDRE